MTNVHRHASHCAWYIAGAPGTFGETGPAGLTVQGKRKRNVSVHPQAGRSALPADLVRETERRGGTRTGAEQRLLSGSLLDLKVRANFRPAL